MFNALKKWDLNGKQFLCHFKLTVISDYVTLTQ